jgi:prepilin-type processing-associated H-X9-DG protein
VGEITWVGVLQGNGYVAPEPEDAPLVNVWWGPPGKYYRRGRGAQAKVFDCPSQVKSDRGPTHWYRGGGDWNAYYEYKANWSFGYEHYWPGLWNNGTAPGVAGGGTPTLTNIGSATNFYLVADNPGKTWETYGYGAPFITWNLPHDKAGPHPNDTFNIAWADGHVAPGTQDGWPTKNRGVNAVHKWNKPWGRMPWPYGGQ